MTEYIRGFQQITVDEVNLVGGKGANLGEMTRAGLPVPPGFCLTAQAYRDFIAQAQALETLARTLAALHPDSPEEVEQKTAYLRDFLGELPMPAEIAAQVKSAYAALGARLGATAERFPVAVRSSATAEDLPNASFAGQQDTYLNIRGEDELLAHVKKCWASLWTARAVTYRTAQRFDHMQVALAVVVQAMIESEISGILFTANPVNHRRDEVVINASWGLGEAIVSGMVTPDTWIARKNSDSNAENYTIVEREIASKDLAIEYAAGGGTCEVVIGNGRRTAPSLDDAQLYRLLAFGDQIQTHYARPMDIEWAFARDSFYMLQARPITTLGDAPNDGDASAGAEAHLFVPAQPSHALQKDSIITAPGEYNRTMFIEIFPDPLSPAFLSVIQPLFHSMLDFTFVTLGFTPPRDIEAVGVFYNQPYFHREYIEAALSRLSPPVREMLVGQIVNPFGKHERRVRGELSPAYLSLVTRLLRFMTGFPKQLPGLLDEYHAEIAKLNALPVSNLTEREIMARIRELLFVHASKLLNYDFLMIALIGITYQMLGSLLERYYGEDSEQVRTQLISGVTGNVTMKTNMRIWDLAQDAKASPVVSAALREYSSGSVREHLKETAEGQAFLKELDAFLVEYGHREIRMDILYPTWGEDPTPVLQFIHGYLDVDDKASPHRQQDRLVGERDATAREVDARISSDLTGRVALSPLFHWVLRNTQTHTRERDTMHFELTRMFPPFRRLLLELAARLKQQGALDELNDVFFLTLAELEASAEQARPMQETIHLRREEFDANKRQRAPGILKDGVAIGEAHAHAEKVNGQIRGVAGSPGRATGTVRVIRVPEDFDQLKHGEILVAPLTNPVWTPLFAIAGGIITEVGGILSHGAIVAREYGIPAVMAVPDATQIFQTGQRVTVDGTSGFVVLEA